MDLLLVRVLHFHASVILAIENSNNVGKNIMKSIKIPGVPFVFSWVSSF